MLGSSKKAFPPLLVWTYLGSHLSAFSNHSQNIWDKLYFSCEIAKYRKVLISISILLSKKYIFFGGRLGSRIEFYEVWDFLDLS